jgi:hypothetical protein
MNCLAPFVHPAFFTTVCIGISVPGRNPRWLSTESDDATQAKHERCSTTGQESLSSLTDVS